MMKRLKTPLILLLIALVVLAIARGARTFMAMRARAVEGSPPVEVAPWSVRTKAVVEGTVRRTYGTLGTLESIAEVEVAGQFPGTILELGPREGERVEKGAVLARIDTEEFDANLAAREAGLKAALQESSRLDTELGREKTLLASGGSTQSKVDARVSAAVGAREKAIAIQKEIDALKTRRAYATVTAPVTGIVKNRLAEVGDLCAAYHPLYTIDATGAARLTVNLPQGLSDSIAVGTKVHIASDGKQLDVALTRMHPELSPLALITADADLTELPFGLPSGARIGTELLLDEATDVLVIPENSVFGNGGDEAVWRIVKTGDKTSVERVGISIDLRGDEGLAVHATGSGRLEPADIVVIGRPERLAKLGSGDAVEIFGGRE